jgi:hypothetical protein
LQPGPNRTRTRTDSGYERGQTGGKVTLLFNIDPDSAENSVPLSAIIDSVHADDRERVLAVIRRSAQEGATYLNEYRVVSADGQTRWVLSRGRFTKDHAGRPVGGNGILVDITRMKIREGTFDEVEPDPFEAPLDRAADHAINAQRAIVDLQDPELKTCADALLIALGRKLAEREILDRCKGMH